LFQDRLEPCRLEFVTAGTRLGRWVGEHRTIELSRSLLTDHGWGVLLEVLKHEMGHQYVYEVLNCHDQSAHGSEFRRVCAERGIDERASGIPDRLASPALESANARALERVAKLLALAQSPNEHEAQNAMSAAQRLMLKYNIEAALHSEPSVFGFRHLGKPTGRVTEAERRLANILAKHFFVECIWVPVWRPFEGKRGSVLEVCGRPENLELAEYVYSFLMHTAEGLWRAYKRQNSIQKNANRRTFLAGVMLGFHDKLDSERGKNQKAGLVWVRDGDLRVWFERRYPRIRHVSRSGPRRTDAYTQGREAGKRIVLHRGVGQGPSSARPLLRG
jgi:hypothetical protein